MKKHKDEPITGLDGIQKAKVRQDYTEKELVGMGLELAKRLRAIDRLRADIARFTENCEAEISTAQGAVSSLAHEIRQGGKLVEVEVDVKAEFDAKANRKKLFTLDGEFIREEKMTDSDHQIALPIGLAAGGGDEN